MENELQSLSSRVETVEEASRRHEAQLSKLDDAVAGLRETMGRVATRDDVDALRRDVTGAFVEGARHAQDAIPAKVMAWFTGALVVISVAALVLNLLHGHA